MKKPYVVRQIEVAGPMWDILRDARVLRLSVWLINADSEARRLHMDFVEGARCEALAQGLREMAEALLSV